MLEAPEPGLSYWAPEVAYDNGRFYLYCSAGGPEGEQHQLRVATASSPLGPFSFEHGPLDPDDPFTIDAHPFKDSDGSWYLFYARDFLDGDRVGTGVVVDRLATMTELAGERSTVARPYAEWQVYERQRRWYERVWDWYTLEGPAVRRRDGRYWCLYSGGAWRSERYGVTYAVADHPQGPYEPGAVGPCADVLTTSRDVVGPGHASVTVGPDNRAEYLVYHAWDSALTGRYMAIDRLVWEGGAPSSPGPTVGAEPVPPHPRLHDLFTDDAAGWRHLTGAWTCEGGALRQADVGAARATTENGVHGTGWSVLEVNLRHEAVSAADAAYGVVLLDGTALAVEPHPGRVTWRRDGTGGDVGWLPAGLRLDAWHQLLVIAGAEQHQVLLDAVGVGSVPAGSATAALGLFTHHAAAAFTGVTLT